MWLISIRFLLVKQMLISFLYSSVSVKSDGFTLGILSNLIKLYSVSSALLHLVNSILFFNLKFNFVPTVAPSKHLAWNWTDNTIYFVLFCTVYLLFFLGAIYLTKNYIFLLFSIVIYLYSMYNYYKDGTISSMWCWIANIGIFFMLFEAIWKKL